MICPMNRPTVIFVLSTNYAGSHLLSQLLAAHSRCAGVGELHNYDKFRGRGSRSGNVVDDYRDHPAFADLNGRPVSDWHRLIGERLAAERPGLTHLVDNSKRPDWARRCAVIGDAYVHLLRDPRALVSRWLATYDTAQTLAAQRRRVLRRNPWLMLRGPGAVDVLAGKWLAANRRIDRFLRRRGPQVRLTYLDLARQPAATLQGAMPPLGLEFEPGQLDYGSADGALGTRKRDYLAASRESRIEVDLRWQQALDPVDRATVENHRAIRRYLAGHGLTLTADGLTRRA